MKFLRNFLACLLALTLFFFGFFLIVVSIATADQLVTVKDDSVLHIKMNRPVTERERENPFEGIPGLPGPASSIGLVEFRSTLAQAQSDERINGVYLEVDGFGGGMAHIEEMRQVIEEFKSSGKFVYAYAKNFGEGGYYLATVADSVFLHPEGTLEFNGLSANVVFLKGLFDKIGIEPQIFRVGDFKSAVEPFYRTEMSNESRLQMTALMEGMNDHMMKGVAENRALSRDSVESMNDKMTVRNARLAMENGLVDGLFYDDELRERLQLASGVEKLNFITYANYRKSYTPSYSMNNRIAVVVASGDILMGEGGIDIIGSEEFIQTIREVRQNDRVKAIVLRINSPGGSYLASDAIWREVKIAAETKPVIASMSNYAASGGYYIAMAADTIVAHPNTITGSIGIFSVLFNTQELFEDKLGITIDGVATGEFTDLYTSARALRPEEKQIIQKEVDNNYDTFIRKAADGRGMEDAAMRAVASGRVWTGEQAKERGLVDILGGMDTAIELAAQKAGISEEYSLRYYPPQKTVLEQFLGVSQNNTETLKQELGMLYPLFREVKKLEDFKGVQARSPYSFEIY